MWRGKEKLRKLEKRRERRREGKGMKGKIDVLDNKKNGRKNLLNGRLEWRDGCMGNGLKNLNC